MCRKYPTKYHKFFFRDPPNSSLPKLNTRLELFLPLEILNNEEVSQHHYAEAILLEIFLTGNIIGGNFLFVVGRDLASATFFPEKKIW